MDILGQQSDETLTAVFLALCVLGASVLLGLVIMLAREGRIRSRYLGALAVVCSIGLLAMLITDWPSEVLARFWADHSVVAGVLSTVLMLGIGFLVFEVRDVNAQEALDNSLTAAGFGGLVDHVVDVEVAMALVAAGSPPDHLWRRKRSKTDRPLRWLRTSRSQLARSTAGGPAPTDPRSRIDSEWPLSGKAEPWRIELVNQCVRRLLAGIRDWAPVVGRSRSGVNALITFAELRNRLLEIETCLRNGDFVAADELVRDVRRRCRVLAYTLEQSSGAKPHRAAVLQTLEPFGSTPHTPAGRAARLFRNDWVVQLESAEADLQKQTERA